MNFSEKEALSILNSSDLDEVIDQYELMIFEWKKKYLMVIPPVKLIYSQIKKIERLNQAITVFKDYQYTTITSKNSTDTVKELVLFFEEYHEILAATKYAISSAENGFELIDHLQQLIQLEESLFRKLDTYATGLDFKNWDSVKISEQIDVFEAEKELKEKEIPESEIKNYLRAGIKAGQYPFESTLVNLILKAHKTIKHGYAGNI